MRDGLVAVRILHGEIEGGLVNGFGAYAPRLRRIGEGLLQFEELGEIGVIERVGFTEVASWVKLVELDFARRRTFLEEEHDGLYACPWERAAGAVEHGVEAATF